MKKELQSFIDEVVYAGNFADGSGELQLMVLAAVLNLFSSGIEPKELLAEIEIELFDSELVRENQWLM